ncbi:hypothetical protein L1987_04328 [Smallanthus sonchifolius]|uniref:Uncharacterized protein n=1 Tax=Smallanthus sonchifolius TaxID=185202 RepID=A0ACB9KD55_9ASTR|nr:hypothetical protein L1987_04328 [Smallanthus sonchifolius]
MDGWKDQSHHFSPEVTTTRSNRYRKPPLGDGSNWQQSVPSWEKKFCASVGSISWKKILETKKIIHLYDDIIKWNDSAGKEAFEKAKNNFYANMYNLPNDSVLPDADIYIDKVNWDSEVDQNLMRDLDSDSVVPNSKDEQVVIFGSSFPPSYQNFSPYGWGDSDDDKKKDVTSPEYNIPQRETGGGGVDNNDNWWVRNENDGCGESRNDYWGWNMYDNNYFYGDVKNESGRYMSRYKTSRFQNDNDRARRNNGNRRKSGYSCARVNPSSHEHRWSVKKPVS